MPDEFDHILLNIQGPVATITLNRPPANPLDIAVLKELDQAVDAIARNDAVRSFIVTGSGERMFCGGADIKAFLSLTPLQETELMDRGNNLFSRIESSPKPSVAAINGYALGGGCELAMACDIRLAATRARLGQTEINLGLLPGWGGIQRLTRLVGIGLAKDLLLTGGQLTADEAKSAGLVTRVVPDAEIAAQAVALAEKLASMAPRALAETKRLINRDDPGPLGQASIQESGKTFERILESADAKEGISSFLEKRSAKYTGR